MPDQQREDDDDDDVGGEPVSREKAVTGIRLRIELAEELAGQAVAAETRGDHRAAAQLYKKAIDTLRPAAEAAAAGEQPPAEKKR